jgi:hypothetical protein
LKFHPSKRTINRASMCNKNKQDALFTLSFTPINNLYMFRAGLLLIIRSYCSVYIPYITYTSYCIYRIVPPDDEQYACSKHVQVNFAYFIWCVSCTVFVLTCCVMCGCVDVWVFW